MSVVRIVGCGGCHAKAELNIDTDDFAIKIEDKTYRIDIAPDKSLVIALINGVDARITTSYGYPAVKLIHK